MESCRLVVEQNRTQKVIHAILDCYQEFRDHKQPPLSLCLVARSSVIGSWFCSYFGNKSQCLFQVRPSFSERASLRIHAGDFLYVGDIPAATYPDDVCNFLLHSGMLPCFFLGLVSRLVSRARRAVMTRARVAAGSMTASI